MTNNSKCNNLPLVSVIITSYNSAQFVIDALDSIYNQTYANIELIITDDASHDDTFLLCEKWLMQHKKRFKSIHLVSSPYNTGTAGNINRGINFAHGEWIKLLAADDILCYDYLEKVIEHILNSNNEIQILYTNICVFTTSSLHANEQQTIFARNEYFISDNITAEEQNEILLRFNPICAAGVIFSRKIVVILGNFDENYPLCEDWFFWFRVTGKGIKIYFYNIIGVKYRKHLDSVQVKKGKMFLSRYDLDLRKGILEIFLKEYPWLEKMLVKWILQVDFGIYNFFSNMRNVMILVIRNLLCFIPSLLLQFIRYKYYKSIKYKH